MSKAWFAALFLLLAPALAEAQTAIRPDQICPGGVCGTPDITWGPGGGGYQIGSTVPWRADNSTNPAFIAQDAAKIVELTNAVGPIIASLPAATGATGAFADGFGFTVQTRALVVTINPVAGTINGATSLKLGPYQSASLLAKGANNWYASLSLPMPSAQTGANRLADNMTWQSPGTAPPVNTVAPTLTGSTPVGSVLTCTQGTWTGATSYAYQMNRDGVAIPGATAATYTVVTADQGHTITCVVTASNAGGPTSYTTSGIAIPSSGIVYIRDNITSSGATGVTTLNVALSSTTAGNLFVVAAVGYNNGVSAQPTATTVTASNGTACFHATATLIAGSSVGAPFTDIWYCPNNAASGSATFTVTYTDTASPANSVNYPSLLAAEFAGATASSGALATGTGGTLLSAALTVANVLTGASVPQVGDLVVSVVVPSASAPTSFGGNQIMFPTAANLGLTYQITTASGVVTHTYNFSATNGVASSIAAFVHP